MVYHFEVPIKELHGMVESENRVREIRTRFNKCWEGLKAFQKHRGVERAGDLTLRLYAEVQKHHSEVVVFDCECSPVVHASQEEEGGGSQTRTPKKAAKLKLVCDEATMPNKKGRRG
jgi:hypothetical protein